MGLDSKLKRTDKKIQEKIRELGGVANIDSPLQQVIVPLANERMYEDEITAVRRLRSDESSSGATNWLDRRPVKEPERKTIGNIADRIVFEELVKAGVEQWQAFTGQKISYDLEAMQIEGDR